jgi:hypothetical protein
MPVYQVPPKPGPLAIVRGKDGTFAVASSDDGGRRLFVPCRDETQAREVLRKLEAGEHDGTLRVDLL